MQQIMDKYPGAGKYIFDFLEDKMSPKAIKRKKHSIISNINANLSKLAQRNPELPDKLSTYHAKYSAAKFIKREIGPSILKIIRQI